MKTMKMHVCLYYYEVSSCMSEKRVRRPVKRRVAVVGRNTKRMSLVPELTMMEMRMKVQLLRKARSLVDAVWEPEVIATLLPKVILRGEGIL